MNNAFYLPVKFKLFFQAAFQLKVIWWFLRDLIPFLQFKEREKHLWRSVTFSKVSRLKFAILLKETLLHGCFSRVLNFTNGTKSRSASIMLKLRTFIQVALGVIHLWPPQKNSKIRTPFFIQFWFDRQVSRHYPKLSWKGIVFPVSLL